MKKASEDREFVRRGKTRPNADLIFKESSRPLPTVAGTPREGVTLLPFITPDLGTRMSTAAHPYLVS
jgi:hypothetical protein